ncbi:thioredoxin domain-containing protein [Flavobacterium zhairuonense]|uniref:vitamin K epoxide reductase family protein n=1 Tax=Flavobacterium zhairuonense TaxID=2493631 RepID=UPI001042F4B6|nr:vitamin K epoxide reductase family protein [Flavobacterium zhairuonense]KAF2511514.1 thioredoxin domain-containing protein [Flavobacterium zhairuonense]
MAQNFNYLFHYLEKENIKVDKVEFLFQIQSHPDYPSILAIADTLTFFNIQNAFLKVNISEIELISKRFIAHLIEKNSGPSLDIEFYFVEQKNGSYFCSKDGTTYEITRSELESRWNGIVFLIEKEGSENIKKFKKNNSFWILSSFCLILFLMVITMFEKNAISNFFLVFPIIGILFSIVALQDLFEVRSGLIDSFCNISSSASCADIISSKKWKIFAFLDLSSLSIVFYTTQLISLFLFVLSNSIDEFFILQKIILFSVIPMIILSIYYQKFIEKKWCPICLAIITILILELIILVSIQRSSFKVSLKSIVLFGFVFFATVLIWKSLKSILTKQKELKEFQLKGNRFMRNYEIFKNSLISNNNFDLPNSSIVLGNQKSETEIAIIISPFCGHCKEVHKSIEEILIAYKNDLKVKIIFNVDIENLDEDAKVFFRSIISIYLEKGEYSFLEALNYWFENKNLNDWIIKYGQSFESYKIDLIYKQQNQWCKNNNLNFTPVIFVNGYQYPKYYNRENLEFFINEILEDEFFVENQITERAIIDTI